MKLIFAIIIIPIAINEIRKSILVLRKNQKHVFLAFRIILSILLPFLPSKRINEINKEYNRRIKSYATQSILFWAFVLIYMIGDLVIAFITKTLF